MRSTVHRREFLKLSAAAGLVLSPAGLFAVEPFPRATPPRLRLSLAAYSFRDYFKDTNHARDTATDAAKRIDLFQFVDYCAAQGCDGTELTSYYFPRDT